MIELLIVIAIIGALAVAVFAGLNPAQRLAAARDSNRIQAVVQLGKALDAYAVGNSSAYVAEGATWVTSLVTAGEITVAPSATAYSVSGISACTTNAQNGYCYDASSAAGAGPIVVYTRLESTAQISKCSSGQNAYSVYSSADGRAGVVCRASGSEPVAGAQTFLP